MDFEIDKLVPFLDDVERGAAQLVARLGDDAAPSKKQAAKTQSLFAKFFVRFVYSKLYMMRLRYLEVSQPGERVWSDFAAAVRQLECLAEGYRGARQAATAVLGKICSAENAPVSLAKNKDAFGAFELAFEVVHRCETVLHDLTRWQSVLGGWYPGQPATRTHELALVSAKRYVFDWLTTERFQVLALAMEGRLVTANHVDRLRSDFRHGKDPFGFAEHSCRHHLGMALDEAIDRLENLVAEESDEARGAVVGA